MIRSRIFLCLFLVALTASASNSVKKDSTNKQSVEIQLKDFNTNSSLLESRYIETLEKTNQQLSLWYNPLSLMVSTLAILFTVLTIISAYIIYRQSKEYRNLLNDKIQDYQNILNQFINEKNEQLFAMQQEITLKIDETNEQLKNSNEADKKELARKISDLENKRNSIQERIKSSPVKPEYLYPETLSMLAGQKVISYHKCTHCNFGFRVDKLALNPFIGGEKIIKCPNCGNEDILNE